MTRKRIRTQPAPTVMSAEEYATYQLIRAFERHPGLKPVLMTLLNTAVAVDGQAFYAQAERSIRYARERAEAAAVSVSPVLRLH
ncbi:MAG TPA: hypothetical protein VD902_09590 [Symbiobacteriaceae bacterium]|nr:hypothetical protein [Symbiobacteriaceae bacterium]